MDTHTQFSSPYSTATMPIQSPVQSNCVATPSTILSDDDEFIMMQNSAVENCPTIGQINKWPEPDYWCTICYYELNSRVGEPFTVSSFYSTLRYFPSSISKRKGLMY
jgi:hypothetical protein